MTRGISNALRPISRRSDIGVLSAFVICRRRSDAAEGSLYIFRLSPSLAKFAVDRHTRRWQELTSGEVIDSAGIVDDSYPQIIIYLSNDQIVVGLTGVTWNSCRGSGKRHVWLRGIDEFSNLVSCAITSLNSSATLFLCAHA